LGGGASLQQFDHKSCCYANKTTQNM
jgi:hypothetical protein